VEGGHFQAPPPGFMSTISSRTVSLATQGEQHPGEQGAAEQQRHQPSGTCGVSASSPPRQPSLRGTVGGHIGGVSAVTVSMPNRGSSGRGGNSSGTTTAAATAKRGGPPVGSNVMPQPVRTYLNFDASCLFLLSVKVLRAGGFSTKP